jgi:hypothetical protein
LRFSVLDIVFLFYEGFSSMIELKVILDFACCVCEKSVSVTVQCAGKGLEDGLESVAAVHVPCPNCNSVNQVYFEPSGTVRKVAPNRGHYYLLEPSLN